MIMQDSELLFSCPSRQKRNQICFALAVIWAVLLTFHNVIKISEESEIEKLKNKLLVDQRNLDSFLNELLYLKNNDSRSRETSHLKSMVDENTEKNDSRSTESITVGIPDNVAFADTDPQMITKYLNFLGISIRELLEHLNNISDQNKSMIKRNNETQFTINFLSQCLLK